MLVDSEELESFMRANGHQGGTLLAAAPMVRVLHPGSVGLRTSARPVDIPKEVRTTVTKTIGIVLFPDFEDLDAIGPREALTMMAKASGGEWQVVLISEDGEPVDLVPRHALSSSTTATRTARRSTSSSSPAGSAPGPR